MFSKKNVVDKCTKLLKSTEKISSKFTIGPISARG